MGLIRRTQPSYHHHNSTAFSDKLLLPNGKQSPPPPPSSAALSDDVHVDDVRYRDFSSDVVSPPVHVANSGNIEIRFSQPDDFSLLAFKSGISSPALSMWHESDPHPATGLFKPFGLVAEALDDEPSSTI